MSIIQRFKEFISPDGQRAVNDLAPILTTTMWTRHSFTPVTDFPMALCMWKSNPIAQACTITYSLMMPEAQIGVITPTGYDFDAPVIGMLTRNNWRIVFGEILTMMCVGGNAYGYKLRNASGAVIGMRWYSDQYFAPIDDGYGDVAAYHYWDGAKLYMIDKADVVHIRGFWYDPGKPLGGASPVALASESIEGFNEAASTVFNVHKNDAVPKTTILLNEEASPEQIDVMERTFKRRYGGNKRGSVGVLWGVQDIKRLALDYDEMGLSETFGQYETRICGTYKVHPIIAGTHMGLSQSTYSNFEQASKDFTNMVRVPFWNMIADQLNAQIAIPDYGVEVGFDLSTVQALAGQMVAVEAVSTQGENETPDDDDNDDDNIETASLKGGAAVKAAPFRTSPAVKQYEDIDFTPPQGVRDEAAKGLEWRREYGRGGTEVGVARARDLSNGRTISPDTARRMYSYFQRHEIDKQGEGWSPGQDGFPSAGRIAWALWGGDPGFTWSKKLVGQMDAEDAQKVAGDMKSVIVDIDGTLLTDSGAPRQDAIDYVNGLHETWYIDIVSGRSEDELDATRDQLREAGVRYDRIHLNDTTAPAIRFKEYKAGLILKERGVHLAIDNDRETRQMYRSLGIPTEEPKTIVIIGPETKAWLHHPDDQVYAKAYDEVLNQASAKIARDWGRALDKLYRSITNTKSLQTKIDDFSVDVWEKEFSDMTEGSREELVSLLVTLATEEVDAPEGEYATARREGMTISSDKIAESVGTIRTDVQKLIADNPLAKEDDLAKLLKAKFTDLKASRADAIARTTSTATTGTVQKKVWADLGGIKREWVALAGARPAHAAAHGEREDAAGNFVVGGETTPYPSGPGLSAGNAVNCRCFTRARRVES